MRILFTFAGGTGHFQPLRSTAAAMATAGHEIAFGAQAAMLPAIAEAGFHGFDTGGATIRAAATRAPLAAVDMAREYRSVSAGYAGRIARQRATAIFDRALSWRPDMLVCDELDFGAMIAAERLSIPYAVMLVIASGQLVRPEQLIEPLNELRAEQGLPRDLTLAMLYRYLVLVPFPDSFREPSYPLPVTAHAFRPATISLLDAAARRPDPNGRPLLYVTLGTIFNVESGDLFKRLLDGLRDLPVDIVATVGPQIDPAELGSQPANIRVERFIEHWELLPHAALVVSHGGSGTVFGALSHGVPLLLLPIGADQPFNADRCEALGVAQVLDPTTATPETIRDAAAALLANTAYRQAAERIRDEIAALPGQSLAIALLTRLARERAPIINRP